MKKLLTLLLTGAMALSLTACGGVDTDAAIEAFNTTNTQLNTLGSYVNENVDKVDEDTVNEIQSIMDSMGAFKAELESDDISQERVDEIIAELNSYPAKITEIETKAKDLIEGGQALTEEDMSALQTAYDELFDIHGNFIAVYDQLDEATQAMVGDVIGASLLEIEAVLSPDGHVVITDKETFLSGVQNVLDSAKTAWAEIEAQMNGDTQEVG